VGFNKGDGVGYMHPLSLTHGVRYINDVTNVGVPGRLLYRIDGSNTIPCVHPPKTGKCRFNTGQYVSDIGLSLVYFVKW